MSEATPKKRRRGEEDDDDYDGDGAVDGDFIHRCIKLKDPETIRMTIRQRRYWEFTHTEDGTLSYLIPLNWLEFFTYAIKGSDGTPGKTVRWDKVNVIAENFGLKIHKAGIVMHSLIPMQQALTVQSGTAVETLTMNTTPYLEIYKDSNCTYAGCQSKDGDTFTLKDWLWNPQIQKFGEAKEYEYPAGNLGTMEQYHVGDRKAYTIYPDTDRWYTFGNQVTAPNLMPIRGGNLDYSKPRLGVKYFHNTPQQCNTIIVRPRPVKGSDGKYLKFHFSTQVDMFIDLEIRLPPDGMTEFNPHAHHQYLHVLSTGNFNKSVIQHAI